MRRQKEIAAALGVSEQTVSSWMIGKTNIGRRSALRLSEVFGRDPSFWMFGDISEIKAVLFFTCLVDGGSGEEASNNQRACG